MKKSTFAMMLAGALIASVPFAASAQAPAQASVKAPVKAPTLEERFAFLPDVVATVGDTKITKKEIIAEFGSKNVPEIIAKVPEKELRDYTKALIDARIDEIILLKLAEKEGVKPSVELVAKQLEADFAKLTPENRAAMEQQLKAMGKTMESMKAEYMNNPEFQKYFAVKTYLDKYFEGKTGSAMTDAEVEAFYNAHKNDAFRKNVDVSHILIMADGLDENKKPLSDDDAKKQDMEAQKKIAGIKEQLDKGANFESLAVQHSQCPSGKSAKGSLGKVMRGQMVPEFENASFEMTKPGEMSGIVRTQFGYHIIRYNGGEYYPLDDSMKAYIREDGVQRKKAELVEKLLDDSRKAMNVTEAEFKPLAAAPAEK